MPLGLGPQKPGAPPPDDPQKRAPEPETQQKAEPAQPPPATQQFAPPPEKTPEKPAAAPAASPPTTQAPPTQQKTEPALVAPKSTFLEERAAAHEAARDSAARGKADDSPKAARNRRRGIMFTVGVYVVSGVAIWVFLALIAARYAGRPLDFTMQREFTLATETRDLLKRLNQPLRMTALFGQTGEVRRHILEEIQDLVDLMHTESRWVEFRRVDPDRDPAATYEIISRLKLETDTQRYRDAVVLEYGNKSTLVPIQRIAQVELMREAGKLLQKEKAFHGEFAFATAILNLLEDQHSKVYFTAGHGELDPENPDGDGFTYARDALREEKTTVEPLFLLEVEKVPDDANAIIIAGPNEPFDAREVVKIEKFLAAGGGVFLCVGPARHSGLESMLGRYGVELGRDGVVDPANKRAGRSPFDLIVRKVGNHPITSSLATSTIEVANTRSVRRTAGNATISSRVERTELLWSSDKSWAELDLNSNKFTRNPENGDINGPVSLGIAVAIPPDANDPAQMARGGVRIVVYGSRELFSNRWLQRSPTNGDLFQNSVHWLARRDRLASVRPRTPDERLFQITETQAQRLALLAYAGVPALFLVIGVFIGWRRRA